MALGHAQQPERHVQADDFLIVRVPDEDMDRFHGLSRRVSRRVGEDRLAVADDQVRLLPLEGGDHLLELVTEPRATDDLFPDDLDPARIGPARGRVHDHQRAHLGLQGEAARAVRGAAVLLDA